MAGIPGIAKDVTAAVLASAIIQALDEGELIQCLKKIEETISSDTYQEACKYLASLNEADYVESIAVPIAGGQRVTLNMHGRRYGMLFVPPGSTAVSFVLPGMAAVDMTLVAGWNDLQLPEGTQIYMTSASAAVNMLYRATNRPFGTTIVSTA